MGQEFFLKEILPVVGTIAIGVLAWGIRAVGAYFRTKTKNEAALRAIEIGEKVAEIAVVGAAQAYVSVARDKGTWGDEEKAKALKLAIQNYKSLWIEKFGKVTESDEAIAVKLEAKLGALKAEGALP